MSRIPRVLVIDDDPVVSAILRATLEKAGLEVVTESDGWNGMKAFETFKPELVLLDINLPGVDGIAAYEFIRTHETGGVVPIIFISGEANRDVLSFANRMGADDFISKPIDLNLLVSRVWRQIAIYNLTWRDIRAAVSSVKEDSVEVKPEGNLWNFGSQMYRIFRAPCGGESMYFVMPSDCGFQDLPRLPEEQARERVRVFVKRAEEWRCVWPRVQSSAPKRL